MAQLVKDIVYGYHDLMDKQSDPRVNHWSMMAGPIPTLSICLFYVYFAKVLGPRLMENRKPLDLRNTLIIYNCLQTIFSTWLCWEFLQSGWLRDYNFRCQPVDYTDKGLRMAETCWWYYFSKFTEFFDTLFFILRKKNSHVSTLHVIHHGCMPMSVWFGLKFAPGGHSTFFSLLNTFVHIVMYFYYMVAAMGPQYQKYIWWKKHLTTFQMVQFVMIFVHQFQLLFVECDYPKAFMVWIAFHGVLFLFLFSDFYKTSYNNKRAAALAAKQKILDAANKKTDMVQENGITNGYANGHTKNYSNCYSNGVNNGYLSTTQSNGVHLIKNKPE